MKTATRRKPYLARLQQKRATEDDWRPLFEEMSRVQKLVHLAARFTPEMRQQWIDRLLAEGIETYRQGLQEELNKVGCPGQKAIEPGGAELQAIQDRVDFAVNSIAGTYDYELARAIQQIRKDVPTANRHVYAHRLFAPGAWDAAYWRAKALVVAQIETMVVVNAATQDFYDRNADLVQPDLVEVLPYFAVCPVCQELVANNPYGTAKEPLAISPIPAHVGCIHRVAVTPKRVEASVCNKLWAGEI